MSSSHRSSSGMRTGRKRANLSILPESEVVSSTGFGRQNYRTSAHVTTPASSFFPILSATSNSAPRPTSDASAHFAYSTTLRRHPDPLLNSPAGIASAVNAEAFSLWKRAIRFLRRQPSPDARSVNGNASPQMHNIDRRDTPSARFAHSTIEVSDFHKMFVRCYQWHIAPQDTIAYFRTSPTDGLMSSDIPTLQAKHGFNEFEVSTPEPLFIKFAKTIYENPLILLLCGSATVSAIMGNVDDAISITVAIIVVLTGEFKENLERRQSGLTKMRQSRIYPRAPI